MHCKSCIKKENIRQICGNNGKRLRPLFLDFVHADLCRKMHRCTHIFNEVGFESCGVIDKVIMIQKLNEKLKIQIEMAKALSQGEQYEAKGMKKVTDAVSGQTSLIEVSKRVKTWWFTNTDTKRVAVQLFYGNKVIDLAKGKNAVEVSNGDELIAVLLKLQEAVLDGSLDSQIAVAAASVRARLKSKPLDNQ